MYWGLSSTYVVDFTTGDTSRVERLFVGSCSGVLRDVLNRPIPITADDRAIAVSAKTKDHRIPVILNHAFPW